MAENVPLLDGFAGKMTRLRESYDILNANWPAAWSPDSLIGTMQMGDRLTYYPDTALTELSALEQKLSALPAAIEAMRTTENSLEFAKTGSDSNPDQATARLAAYKTALDAAMARITDVSETKPRVSLDKPSGGTE
jgi:hypothetical protein